MIKREAGENTPGDTPEGGRRPPWKPGQSGNPEGRPKGSRIEIKLAGRVRALIRLSRETMGEV